MSRLRSVFFAAAAAGTLAACGLPRPATTSGAGGTFATAAGIEKAGKPFGVLRFTPATRGQAISGTSVARHPSGDLVIAGRFNGQANVGLGMGQLDGDITSFVGRYSAEGQPRWVSWMSGTGADDGPRVVVDGAGNVVVLASGRFPMRPFGEQEPACKERAGCPILPAVNVLSPDGATRLTKTFPVRDARERMRPRFVGTDASGDLTVAGQFGAGADLFVARYAAGDGERRWFTRVRASGGATLAGLTVTPQGQAALLGDANGDLHVDDFALPAKASSGATFVLGLDREDGRRQWMQRLDGDTGSNGLAIASDSAGEIYVVAKELAGTRWSALIQKLAPATGEPHWSRRMGQSYNGILGASIDVTRGGAPVIVFRLVGSALDTGLAKNHPPAEVERNASRVVALSSEGTALWSRELSTPTLRKASWSLEATSVASMGPSEAIVTGWFSGRADLGGLRAEGPWRHLHKECFDDDDDGDSSGSRDCSEEWAARAMFVARIAP